MEDSFGGRRVPDVNAEIQIAIELIANVVGN
jgi:hypothetical protein